MKLESSTGAAEAGKAASSPCDYCRQRLVRISDSVQQVIALIGWFLPPEVQHDAAQHIAGIQDEIHRIDVYAGARSRPSACDGQCHCDVAL